MNLKDVVVLSAKNSFIATLLVAVLFLGTFVVFEPVVGRAAIDIFTVSQTITAEISFNASTTDVSMTPSIPGVTGGTAYGSTTVRVTTNSTGGYNMTIQFSSSTAMNSVTSPQQYYISNYSPTAPGVPDFAFAIGGSGTSGEFGYSVTASTTSDIDPTFLDDGGTCGTGGADAVGGCWYNASTTGAGSTIAERIINRTSPTEASGSTSTVLFQVRVPSSPSPALLTDTYVATATLTATAQ